LGGDGRLVTFPLSDYVPFTDRVTFEVLLLLLLTFLKSLQPREVFFELQAVVGNGRRVRFGGGHTTRASCRRRSLWRPSSTRAAPCVGAQTEHLVAPKRSRRSAPGASLREEKAIPQSAHEPRHDTLFRRRSARVTSTTRRIASQALVGAHGAVGADVFAASPRRKLLPPCGSGRR
jgi:hypothetical protein